jgi:hypothetical protein
MAARMSRLRGYTHSAPSCSLDRSHRIGRGFLFELHVLRLLTHGSTFYVIQRLG